MIKIKFKNKFKELDAIIKIGHNQPWLRSLSATVMIVATLFVSDNLIKFQITYIRSEKKRATAKFNRKRLLLLSLSATI